MFRQRWHKTAVKLIAYLNVSIYSIVEDYLSVSITLNKFRNFNNFQKIKQESYQLHFT